MPVDALAPSGITPVTGTFLTTATGQSASFTPIGGRSFNVSVNFGSGATGSIQLEWYVNSAIGWSIITAAGTQLYVWTGSASEQVQTDQFNTQFRLNCTAHGGSGTITYSISQ